MTTTLNASTAGAGGFIATSDNSGSLALQTAGTTALNIDSSQNITTTNKFAKASMPAGSVLQVVQVVKNDTFSAASSTFVAITGLSASITPLSTSSKILVTVALAAGAGNSGYDASFALYKNSSILSGSLGAASSSHLQATIAGVNRSPYEITSISINYLDSPATTSSTTYDVRMLCNGTVYVNREEFDSNDVNGPRTISTITLMEIGA